MKKIFAFCLHSAAGPAGCRRHKRAPQSHDDDDDPCSAYLQILPSKRCRQKLRPAWWMQSSITLLPSRPCRTHGGTFSHERVKNFRPPPPSPPTTPRLSRRRESKIHRFCFLPVGRPTRKMPCRRPSGEHKSIFQFGGRERQVVGRRRNVGGLWPTCAKGSARPAGRGGRGRNPLQTCTNGRAGSKCC